MIDAKKRGAQRAVIVGIDSFAYIERSSKSIKTYFFPKIRNLIKREKSERIGDVQE